MRDTYSKWECYINDIPLKKCNILLNRYDKSFDYFVGRSDNEEVFDKPKVKVLKRNYFIT